MTASATGTLAATPLAHALVYARNRRLTGRLDLAHADSAATITLSCGAITAVTLTPYGLCPGGYLGAVLYELGAIDMETLDESLRDLARTKRLHGEILIEAQKITARQRDEALVEQIHRKVQHLFTLPDETTYAFYEATPTPAPVAVDSVGPVWRGIRNRPPETFVRETMRRVADHPLRATHVPARLPPAESALLDALRTRPMTIDEMIARSDLPRAHVELLVYLLVIAKCVEAVSGARTYPSTGPLPISMPSGPPPASARFPIGSSRPPPVSGARPSAPSLLRTPAELGLEGIALRARNIDEESYFEVLGVVDGASAENVRAAYARLAKTWHPDKLVADFQPVRGEVARVFARMTSAHKTLCDPSLRRAYVEKLAAKTRARPRIDVLRDIEHALASRSFDAALRHCEELRAQDTDDAQALALHAWASVRAGEATDEELRIALAKLDKAVNVNRASDEAVYYRGLVYQRLGNTASAFRDFARAVQLNPQHAAAEREVRQYAMRVRKGV
jgi:hypothetical protein